MQSTHNDHRTHSNTKDATSGTALVLPAEDVVEHVQTGLERLRVAVQRVHRALELETPVVERVDRREDIAQRVVCRGRGV